MEPKFSLSFPCVPVYRCSFVRESSGRGNSTARNECVSRNEVCCFGVAGSSAFISTSGLNMNNEDVHLLVGPENTGRSCRVL